MNTKECLLESHSEKYLIILEYIGNYKITRQLTRALLFLFFLSSIVQYLPNCESGKLYMCSIFYHPFF